MEIKKSQKKFSFGSKRRFHNQKPPNVLSPKRFLFIARDIYLTSTNNLFKEFIAYMLFLFIPH